MTQAYPLHWPEGRPRTRHPERSRFDVTPDRACRELLLEVERLGGRHVVISTHVPVRQDGLPRADRRVPNDPGVAVYFVIDDRRMCFACDRWDRVHDNMRAIGKTIGALRGIERWGTGEMVSAAFRGFEALPAPQSGWRATIGLGPDATLDDAEAAYRRRMKHAHPDAGGSADQAAALNAAIRAAREELGP